MNNPQYKKITAVLDSCVLYPAQLRDLFMHLALKRVFRPRWSNQIHDEWIAAVLRNRPDLSDSQLLRTRSLMDAHIIGCLVTGYERHLSKIILPDPKDRHVVAAAIEANADVIVTFNMKDFPIHTLAKFGLYPLHPDSFLENLLIDNPMNFMQAVIQQQSSLKKPSIPLKDFIQLLANSGLPITAQKLSEINWEEFS